MPDTPTKARQRSRVQQTRRRWPAVVGVALAVLVIAVAVLAAAAPGLLRSRPSLDDETRKIAAAIIFAASYLALAIGKIPGLSIDRAGVALVGACLMVVSGALPLEDAYKAVDLDTLTLLLGMMIVVASLRLSGFFALATAWVVRRASNPLLLLCAVAATSGVFSAFLVNDAICLVLAPLVLELTLRMRRNPVPYLLAVAMASNVGSTATITGNPQNIMIGSFSGIPVHALRAGARPGRAGRPRRSRSVSWRCCIARNFPAAAMSRGQNRTSASTARSSSARCSRRRRWSRCSSPASRPPKPRSSSAACCC